MVQQQGVLALFDVDGTLTLPRKVRLLLHTQLCVTLCSRHTHTHSHCTHTHTHTRTESGRRHAGLPARAAQGETRTCSVAAVVCMLCSHSLCLHTHTHTQHVEVGIVGGSDLHKIQEQLGDNCECACRAHWRGIAFLHAQYTHVYAHTHTQMHTHTQICALNGTQIQELGAPAQDASGAPTAEQLVVLGRLCSALSTDSRYLQVRCSLLCVSVNVHCICLCAGTTVQCIGNRQPIAAGAFVFVSCQ